ncbi:MAG TPA: EfeM/EfeO family lipoprotein [Solirubrobacteraceae bacterium]|jgi:high-affinity iron transporter
MLDSTARRWTLTALAAACVAVGVFLALTALGVGRSTHHTDTAAPYALTPLATYLPQAPHVRSKVVVESSQGAVQGASATPAPELPPLPASAFATPIAAYRRYALAQLRATQGQLVRLQVALQANDRAAAQTAWSNAFAGYLRLGAVYLDGQVALGAKVTALNKAIDGTPGGLAHGVASPQFTGFHRIEYGLWSGAAPRALVGYASALAGDVSSLARLLPRAPLTPLEYATRAHEILEDAARDFLSGADVPLSGEGVLATDAGLAATEEVVATLHPLLKRATDVTGAVDTELATLRAAMSNVAAAHGGRLPTNTQLTQQQSESLDGALEGALEALSQVPGALETEAPPQTPQIPSRDVRIDP